MDKSMLALLIESLPAAAIKQTLRKRLANKLRYSASASLTSYEVALLEQLKPRAASLLLAKLEDEEIYNAIAPMLKRKIVVATLRQAQEKQVNWAKKGKMQKSLSRSYDSKRAVFFGRDSRRSLEEPELTSLLASQEEGE